MNEKPVPVTSKVMLKSLPFDVVEFKPESVKRARLTTPCPSNLESGMH